MGSDHVVAGMALPTKAALLFLQEKRAEAEEKGALFSLRSLHRLLIFRHHLPSRKLSWCLFVQPSPLPSTRLNQMYPGGPN